MIQSEHLTESVARSIADGTANPLDADRWLSHLDECDACASAFQEQLDSTSLGDRLRDAMTTEDPYPKETGFQRLSGWIKEGLATERANQHSLQMKLPTKIGNYELIRMIGYGGMGVVFEAKQRWLNRNVAIKLMRSDKGIDQHLLHQFTREFEAVGRLDHPGIVRAIDAGCSQGHAFLVMELVDGLDLEKVRRHSGVLSESNVIEIAIQAAAGLAHAHQHGVIHCDVKPSNLMLGRDRDVSIATVRITDLGLGQVETALISDSKNRGSDSFAAGTEGYQAPEQRLKSRRHHENDISSQSPMVANPRVDIYSLGATLLSLATDLDRSQWTSEDARQCNQLSTGFRNLVAVMLSHASDDRPVTMNEVLKELQRLQSKGDEQNRGDLCLLLNSASRISEADTVSNGDSWKVLTERVAAQSKAALIPLERSPSSRLVRSPVVWIVALLLVIPAVYFALPEMGKRKIVAAGNSAEATMPAPETLHKAADSATPVSSIPLSQQVAHEVIRLGGKWETANSEGETLGFQSVDEFPDFPVEIDWIMVMDSEANDQFIDMIVDLKHLCGLVLSNTHVTDAGVKRLGQMKSLQFVYLYETDITDEAVAELAKLPQLTKLIISETAITNKSLVMLEGCELLTRLAIKNTRADFGCLPSLAKLTALEHLNIRAINVGDEHLMPLLNLHQLNELELTRTKITAVGIENMMKLPKLRLVMAGASQISAAKADELMRRYPNVKIIRDPQE